MRPFFLLVALAACSGEPASVPQAPVPVEQEEPTVAAPSAALDDVIAFEVEATHASALAGSPALAASFDQALGALRKAVPVDERMGRVTALRAKAMADVPEEDASALALRAAYDAALAAAFESFFTAYAEAIVDSEVPAGTKSQQLQSLEAALMGTGWDWDLPRRDLVQAKLMMAMRAAG